MNPSSMTYIIARGKETFGPYTEPELRAYLASGNLVAKDRVRVGTKKKTQPLEELLETFDQSNAILAGLRTDIPSPPDIAWGIALLLDIFTAFTFFVVWDIVEGIWMYRVRPGSRALWFFVSAGLLLLLNSSAIYSFVAKEDYRESHFATPATLFLVVSIILRLFGRFSMRKSLLEHFNETEPIGLKLSKFKTFLFGGLYFQYHFNRINNAKQLLEAPQQEQQITL